MDTYPSNYFYIISTYLRNAYLTNEKFSLYKNVENESI